MASIVSTGIGSGLDVQNLVQQLVAAEGQPTEIRIARQEARLQAELSAFGSIKSALSSFRSQVETLQEQGALQKRSVTVGNEEVFSATVDENALPAEYNIEVVQLAQSQQLISGAFTDANTAVGTGTLTISVGSSTFDVAIDSDGNTLSNIQDAINASVNNAGVSASIVNADDGSYLVLRGDTTGAAQAITVTQSGGDGGLAALTYDPGNGLNSLTETQAAQDATIRVNGLEVSSSSNSVSDAIDGVTLELLAANTGSTASLNIANDKSAVKAQVDAFVNAYNELVDAFNEQTAFNAEAEVGAPLLGDATVRGVREQLRRELITDVTDIEASFNSLIGVGLTTQLDGKLSVDSAALDDILDTEFAKFDQLFSASDGYAQRIGTVLDRYLDDTEGVLTDRLDGIEASIEDLDDQREALSLRLESVETRLLKQFNALDALVGQLTSTSNFLSQQLSQLANIQVNSSRR